jgi:hypothetical protein
MCSMSSKELETIFWLFTIVICKDGPKTKYVNWILNSKLQIRGFRVLRKETASFQEKRLKLYHKIMFRIKKLLNKQQTNFLITQSKLCKVSVSQRHLTVTGLVLITHSLQVAHFLKKVKELHFLHFHYYK